MQDVQFREGGAAVTFRSAAPSSVVAHSRLDLEIDESDQLQAAEEVLEGEAL